MEVKLHKNARTTLAIRSEIKNSKESVYYLSKKFNLNWGTVKRWKDTDTIEDKSSRPHKLNTTLTTQQEELICFERKQFKKTIEDIFFTLEGQIPGIYPMKIYRCLKRHGLNTLPSDFVHMERRIKKFRRYGIGYLHIDLLYAPKINKERSYIYTAIDRVCKVAYVMLDKSKTKETGSKFLSEVIKFYLYKINYILTDNGTEFSYKALPHGKKTQKLHPFDKICQDNKIQHRTIKFKHPWTNGMVENFNKRIKRNLLTKYKFSSIFDLNGKLLEFVDDYNQNKRLKNLGYKTPTRYLKDKKNIITQRIVI